jgi:DNA-binding NtrC family response regulator
MSLDSNQGSTERLSDEELLQAVNDALVKAGSTGKVTRKYIQKLIEITGSYEVLAGKHILLVDDIEDVLEALVPILTVATHGKAEYLLHQSQNADVLCNEIAGLNPEYVLMDYNLAEELKGDVVVQKLFQNHPNIKCIGFSSEKQKKAFSNAGAIGSVEKSTNDNEGMIKAIAEIIENT